MSRDLLTMVEVLAHEKNVDQSVVLAALESALASAVKKAEFPGEDADIVVTKFSENGLSLEDCLKGILL